MKIQSITLENFGVYSRKTFTLDSAPLVVIFGENETGKTTALNGIRQSLFGFRLRNPYLTGRAMQARVAVRLASGQLLEYVRKKGRPDELSGTLDNNLISSQDIASFFGGLELDAYENLFGFSQQELRLGEASLKDVRLADALAGGGFGGVNALQLLQSELEESQATIYKSRAPTSQINVQLAAIHETHDALRKTQVLPSEVQSLRQRLAAATQLRDELREQHKNLHQKRADAKRLLEALPIFQRRLQVIEQLQAIQIPDGIDMVAVASWGDYQQQRQTLKDQLERAQGQLILQKKQLESVVGRMDFAGQELAIEQLGHQSQEIVNKRERLASLKQQRSVAQAACERLLSQLELKEINEQVRSCVVSDLAKARMEELAQEFAAVAHEIVAVSAKRDALIESSNVHDSPATDSCPDDLLPLSELVSQMAEAEREFQHRSADLQRQLQSREMQDLALRLSELLTPGVELSTGYQLAAPSKLQELESRMREAQSRCQVAVGEIEQLQSNSQALVAQLEALQRGVADSPIESYRQLSERRAKLILDWLDDLSQPLIAASIGPEQQRDRLLEIQELSANADQAQQSVVDSAESMAAIAQLKQKVEAELAECSRRREALAKLENDRQLASEEWTVCWADLPVKCSDPRRMIAWAGEYQQWSSLQTQVLSARKLLRMSRCVRDEIFGRLQDLWPTVLPVGASLQSMQETLATWSAQQRDLARQQERAKTAQQSMQQLTRRLAELGKRESAIAKEYESWLSSLPIGSHWPIQRVGALMDSLQQLRSEDARVESMSTQIAELQSQLERFGSHVDQVATAMQTASKTDSDENVLPNDTPPEVLAEQWLRHLQATREGNAAKIRLTSSIEHLTINIQANVDRLQEIEQKLVDLSASAGSPNSEVTQSVMQRAQAADDLRKTLGELNASLRAVCGTTPLEEFLAQLAGVRDTQLEIEIHESSRGLTQLEEQRADADQEIGSLNQMIQHVADNQASQRKMQQLQNQRGELAELAEQWITQRVAQWILRRSIEKFAADHEPELLQLTRHYLTILTNGRYVSVEHETGKSSGFVVRNASEEAFTADRLSTGTREQLYLAIRMAYIEYHCSRSEPLPVIMDDCFVNFDDTRTGHALRAIANWNPRIQTILLSCHQRIPALIAEIAPDTPIIHLDQHAPILGAK
ncbi:MAG: AAA family ATPase [Planctomycetales bacterium]|nr:AAA family ATPase [Planctomycetales bacterium]